MDFVGDSELKIIQRSLRERKHIEREVVADVKNIDYSYMNYPEHSQERIIGRRKEAWELASRLTGKPIEEVHHTEYERACAFIVIKEANRLFCNNWRKMHGLPMKRRKK